MFNIDTIDKELYNSIYVSPRIGDYKEIWTRIRGNKEILNTPFPSFLLPSEICT